MLCSVRPAQWLTVCRSEAGDEVCCSGITVKEIEQVASFLKARSPPGVFTYLNECGHTCEHLPYGSHLDLLEVLTCAAGAVNRTEMAGRRKMPEASMDNITCPDGLPASLDYISVRVSSLCVCVPTASLTRRA